MLKNILCINMQILPHFHSKITKNLHKYAGFLHGGDDGSRTHDLLNAIQAL